MRQETTKTKMDLEPDPIFFKVIMQRSTGSSSLFSDLRYIQSLENFVCIKAKLGIFECGAIKLDNTK